MTGIGGVLPTVIVQRRLVVAAPWLSVTRSDGVVRAGRRVGERRVGRRRVAERAVAVEIPGVGDRVAVGIGRRRAVEGHLQRRRPARRGRRGARASGGWLAGEVLDPPDRAAVEVDVEEVAARPDLQIDRIGRRRQEGRALRRDRAARSRPCVMTQMQSRL